MSGPELLATLPGAAPALPWFAWEPVSPVGAATVVIGVAALMLAARGLRMMRLASEARNRQLDAQSETLAELMRGMQSLSRSMDERTAALLRGQTGMSAPP